jgi:beta-glucosidase
VLRKEWGWNGFTVSDYYAIEELNDRPMTHGQFVAADKKEACVLAVKAGVNIEFPEPDCYLHLVEMVKSKKLKEKELDDLVAPMLHYKFKMGLFEDPYVDPEVAEKASGCDEHRPLALQAAREAITLLKNEGNLVPLDAGKLKTIAVIGPNADRCLHGGYSHICHVNVSILDGIKAKVGEKVNVVHSEGCKIMQPGMWAQDELFLSDPEEDRKGIEAAVEVANGADVVVLCIGGNELTSREAWKRDIHMGDRANLDLFGRQQELVDAILATGKPVVAILNHGRPNSINKIARTVPAIFECWYLGQESGHAVAEVLFGEYNPGG